MSRRKDWREIGGQDALDAAFRPATRPEPARWLRGLRTRAALGLGPALAPAVLFVPIGMALGPSATNLLSPVVLASLESVVAIALAALGVFVGLALDVRAARDRGLFLAACVEAAVTVTVVSAAFWYLLTAWQIPLALPVSLTGLALGLCAAASSAAVADRDTSTHRVAARIADLDDVLPIVVGALVAVMLGASAPMPIWLATGWIFRTLMLGVAVGTAGWLLFERAHSRAERNVFVAGTLALLGGTTAFLDLSPLLAGLTAGLLWTWLPGRADRIVRNDLEKYQHPLIVVLLLVAGASCLYSREAIWISAPLVLFRLAGKLAGGWLAMRVQRVVTPGELGSHLLAPGLLGIALALHLHYVVRSAGMTAILTAVVIATLVSEALAVLLHTDEEPAA